MAFWKVYKWRRFNQYMFNYIYWYSTYGRYDEETRAKIDERRKLERKRNKEESKRLLSLLCSMSVITVFSMPDNNYSRNRINEGIRYLNKVI